MNMGYATYASTSSWNDESRRQVIDTTTALKRLVIKRYLDEISPAQFAADRTVVTEDCALLASRRMYRSPASKSRLEGQVQEVLHDTVMKSRYLELNRTESILMQDAEGAESAHAQLKDLGGQLSLDDFGTGYSSHNLEAHACDEVPEFYFSKPLSQTDVPKIDRSFVCGIDTNRNDVAQTHTVIGLAECLEPDTIAEGVDNETRADLLRAWGCRVVQGNLFHRRTAGNEISALLHI